MRRPSISKTCGVCRQQFRTYASQNKIYCSNACRFAAAKGRPAWNSGAHADPQNFYASVEKTEGCWNWTGHCNTSGYGHLSLSGRLILAHRHAWSLENGPIPDGALVLHHCDNRRCVRIEHLYLGTHLDNARDREQRGRGRPRTGEAHPSAKLTAESVAQIRARYAAGEPASSLAREFSINYRTVHQIVRGATWRTHAH